MKNKLIILSMISGMLIFTSCTDDKTEVQNNIPD